MKTTPRGEGADITSSSELASPIKPGVSKLEGVRGPRHPREDKAARLHPPGTTPFGAPAALFFHGSANAGGNGPTAACSCNPSCYSPGSTGFTPRREAWAMWTDGGALAIPDNEMLFCVAIGYEDGHPIAGFPRQALTKSSPSMVLGLVAP